jgi:hypothetical protein
MTKTLIDVVLPILAIALYYAFAMVMSSGNASAEFFIFNMITVVLSLSIVFKAAERIIRPTASLTRSIMIIGLLSLVVCILYYFIALPAFLLFFKTVDVNTSPEFFFMHLGVVFMIVGFEHE